MLIVVNHFFLYLIGRQAFTTLHMMYHEATACHVTGDLTEVLMILHNLLVCCRPHSNKPGTSIKRKIKQLACHLASQDKMKCKVISIEIKGETECVYF